MPDPINWSLALPYLLAALAFGYLLGSIPFGLVFSRMAGLGDIRNIGSGNIGATNVLRTGNKFAAAATLLADVLKGAFAYGITERFYGIGMAMMAGLGAFLGHCFPVWLKFRGGKAVAVFLGITMPIFLKVTLVFCAVWITVASLTGYSSLAGIIAAIITPIAFFILGYVQAGELFTLLAIILVYRHRDNIKRLLAGEESMIGKN